MTRAAVLVAAALAATGCRSATFDDCTIACTAATGCPSGFSCSAEGFCRSADGTAACAGLLADGGRDAATDDDAAADAPTDGPASTFCSDPAIRACYRFDEGAGGLLGDGSPAHNDGTISGATWVTGHRGSALRFDGALTTQVTIPDTASLRITGTLTVEAWVKPSVVGTDGLWDRLIDRGINSGYGMGLGGGTSSACFRVTTALATPFTCSLDLVPIGAWTHVAGTYDGTAIVVYVDGAASDSEVLTGAIETPALSMVLGNRAEGTSTTSYPYTGAIDDVRIYARAKSAAEICAAAGRTWTGTTCQ